MDAGLAVTEGEEALTLSEILSSQSKVITEEELWALCRECALTLEYVQNQRDMYEGLCITPETVAFDQTGSVCFLDLGLEPEPFYVPPEYENGGSTDKAQLFSLGMTMLYAVEHNDTHKPELSQKLTDLLSKLTADDSSLRPELDAVISECEDVLHGQSSQDICLQFSTIIPSPTQEANSSSILDLTSGLTAYLQSQSGIVVNQSPASDLGSLHPENTDRKNMDAHYRNRPVSETCAMDSVSKNFQDNEISFLDKNQNVKYVNSDHSGNEDQYIDRKLVNHGGQDHHNMFTSVHQNVRPHGKHSLDHPSGSTLSEYYSHRTSVSSSTNVQGSSAEGSGGDCPGRPEGSALGPSVTSETHQSVSDSPGHKRQVSSGEKDNLQNGRFSSLENHASTPNSSGVEDNQLPPSPSKESKKRQGMTISDIIDWINRYIREKELWALCREGVLALQRKKKHLPAYISPDTVVVRGDGSVTFKAIPEDKPLEVIFMAPELQQKGVLSEKTCLYGLGITLRCAAGQKYSTSLSLQVSEKFEQLLLALLQPSPDKRPSLQDTLQMCDDHEADRHLPSKMTCLELYDNAANASQSIPQENTRQSQQSPAETKHQHQQQLQQPQHPQSPAHLVPISPPVDDDDVVSEEELNLEYVVEEEQDLGYDHLEDGRSSTEENGLDDYEEEESYVDEAEEEFHVPSPPTGFKPVATGMTNSNSSQGSPGSAFKPVSTKPGQSGLSDGLRVPSAYSFSATHFKPIVLHETTSCPTSQKDGNPTGFNLKNKEKEVMKKLKELQNDLSKSRKFVGKDIESSNSEHQEQSHNGKEYTAQESAPPNPLESLLQQLQDQGQMPNTQSLASAIAHHLKTQTVPSGHLAQTAAELPSSLTSTQMHQMMISGQSVPPGMSSNPVQQQMLLSTQFPAMVNPGQSYPLPHPHHNMLDQSHSFPMQYGSGIYPGYPPMQFQQDPRTGLMTWAPILPYSSPPPSVALGASLPLSQSPEFYRNTSSNPSQTLSGYSSDSHSNQHRSDLNESLHNEELSSSPYRSHGPSAATTPKRARDHVPLHRHSVSHTQADGYTSDANVVRRPKSEQYQNPSPVSVRDRHSLHNVPEHDHHGHLTNESRSSPHIKHFQSSMKQLSVPGNHVNQSDSLGATSPQRLANQNTSSSPRDDSNASQTSSPSPSRDSGVSGVQLPVKPYPYQNTDASLMDRLLSPESIHRQKVQGRVLQLVREEQGFDMLFEQNAEDCAMAEYITSLANLKWETFVSAITEKYSELYWGEQLMCRLYNTINCRPNIDTQTSSMSRTPPPPPARYSSYVVTEHMTRDRSDNRKSDWRQSLHPQQNSANQSSQQQQQFDQNPNKMSQHSATAFDHRERERRYNDRPNRYQDFGSRKAEPLPNKPKIVTSSAYSPKGPKHSAFSKERSQSACPRFIGSSTISETSDSTDTEMREKRRRYKKRYELDRAKSSSMHNLSSGAMFSAPENRRSDSYVIDIPLGNGFLSQGKITPVNRGTPHQTEEFGNGQYSDSVHYKQSDYSVDKNTNSSERSEKSFHSQTPDSRQRNSYQEKYIDNSNRPPTRKAVSLSPTPILDYATRYSSGNFVEYKYNSLPRDVFRRQTSTSAQSAVCPIQQYSNSRQPILDRKQEITQRVGRDRDHSNTSLLNISEGELVSKPTNESDTETAFRDNVRRTTAKIMQQNNDRRVTDENRNSYRGNGNVKEKVSQAKQQKVNQSGQRTASTSSLPAGQSFRSSGSDKTTPGQLDIQVYTKKGQVVYHWSGIQLNMASDMEHFIQEIEQEEDNKSLLEQRLTAVNQQLTVQRKERKTSQKFYRKLTEPTFRAEKGVDQKSGQVLKNLSEMTKKIRFLVLCKTHLQMLLTELHGLDPSYLYSLLALQDNKALVLQPYTENPSLQFQPVREPHSGCEVQVLHAGDPKGLIAYLFTASALSDGYVHQFLYTFRYFITPEQLFDFIRTRYIAACRASPPDSNIVRVMHRAVDLLHFWLEGFYSIDFEKNTSLTQRLDAFVREYVNSANPDGASSLRHLMQACKNGPNSELLGDTIGDTEDEERSTCFVHLETSKKKSRAEMLEEWDSFRSSTKVKVTPKHRPSLPDLSMDLEKFRMARSMMDITSPTTFTRGRADAFCILDYSPNNLAEQLTLMEQDLFLLTHPVHYLNSKAQGVGVSLSMPGMRTPSMQRRNREPEVTSLFVMDTKFESVIQRIISYNQEVSHWVAAEIVTCTSSKSQCAIMNRFIQLAQLCAEIRNFSTCLAVLDGLENLIVRQLPTWKNLSSKCADIMEELEKIKVNIKGEQNYLMKEKDSHLCPTIPSVLYFLLHTQQLEIGSFQLANGMYKWNKMRSINKMIDQIRIFRENEYLFEPDETLQDAIQQRIMDFSDQDLHAIASTNETNFRKITGGGLSGVFKKVKGKLQSKGEK